MNALGRSCGTCSLSFQLAGILRSESTAIRSPVSASTRRIAALSNFNPRLAGSTTGTSETFLRARGRKIVNIAMSTSAATADSWPSPNAFNALPLSSRTKVYCDYGDEGKMTWKPHEEPPKHPLPPFNAETALQKTKAAEAAWNTKDPAKVAGAYSPDTVWRNRDEIFAGREEVQAFLTRKWSKENGYVLKKHLWAFEGNRISARFEYEWHDEKGQWYRTHGNEQWEFDDRGYMRWRDMSGNDIPIDESERRLA